MATAFDDLSAELIIRVLSHLSRASDVLCVQQVSRRLRRLASDNVLWRHLFVQDFLARRDEEHVDDSRAISKRRRNDAGGASTSASSERSIQQLPRIQRIPLTEPGEGAAFGNVQLEDDSLDWRALYRVSRSWQIGHFSSRRLDTAREGAQNLHAKSTPPNAAADAGSTSSHSSCRNDTLVASSGDLIFTASRGQANDAVPSILAFRATHEIQKSHADGSNVAQEPLARFRLGDIEAPGGKVGPNDRIVALAADTAFSRAGVVRLAAIFSQGRLALIQYDCTENIFRESGFHALFSRSSTAAICAYHSPYLAVCSNDFKISTYYIDAQPSPPRLVDERRSYTSHWPANLHMQSFGNDQDEEHRLCLSVAYTLPVYPRGWTVGLQEIVFRDGKVTSSRSSTARRTYIPTRLDVPERAASSLRKDAKQSEQIDANSGSALDHLTSLSYENPFVVVGSRDNDAICFRVEGATRGPHAPDPPLEIEYVQTLQGHTGSVYSVSLSGGRCLTGGGDGSVRVWRLGDEEHILARATGLLATLDGRLRRGIGKVVSMRPSDEQRRKRKRGHGDGTEDDASTLAQIMRRAKRPADVYNTPNTVIRWVSSTFDRIISVSSTTALVPHSQAGCRSEARDEEQVQIWSFSS